MVRDKDFLLAVYEWFNKMLELVKKRIYSPLFNFYDMLTGEEKKDFIETPSKYKYNPYISKYYLNFIYEMIKYLKLSGNQSQLKGKGISYKSKTSNTFMEDSSIINQAIGCLKNVYEVYKSAEKKKETIENEDDLAYQDITNYTLDILLELLNLSVDTKSLSSEDQKYEYSVIYLFLI